LGTSKRREGNEATDEVNDLIRQTTRIRPPQ